MLGLSVGVTVKYLHWPVCRFVQEELKIQRLRCSLLVEEELETRERELLFKLEHKKELKVGWLHLDAFI